MPAVGRGYVREAGRSAVRVTASPLIAGCWRSWTRARSSTSWRQRPAAPSRVWKALTCAPRRPRTSAPRFAPGGHHARRPGGARVGPAGHPETSHGDGSGLGRAAYSETEPPTENANRLLSSWWSTWVSWAACWNRMTSGNCFSTRRGSSSRQATSGKPSAALIRAADRFSTL